ncbi:MAG TPA: hypothetical protein VH352_16615 [Pseudonocardiaceae bacterium]|nr:hypothetical protein [Pseudonocardiaceae bacterium]
MSEFVEFEVTRASLRGGKRPVPVAIRPSSVADKQWLAAQSVSPNHVRIAMINVVTDAMTGSPPSAQDWRT